jgi:hypothetical protein
MPSRLEERSTVYYHFLQAFGYPVAGKYPKTPNHSKELLPIHNLEENYSWIYYHFYQQARAMPGNHKFSKNKKKKVRLLIFKDLEKIAQGKNASDVVNFSLRKK